MLYDIMGERMTAGQVWDAWMGGQSVMEFLHVAAQDGRPLGAHLADYVETLPETCSWVAQGIEWTDADIDAIEDGIRAYLAEHGVEV